MNQNSNKEEAKKPKPWKKIGKEKILAQSRGRKLFIQQYTDPYTGEMEKFTLFGSAGSTSTIFAVTTEKKVLAVRQYRHAHDYISLELPGGRSKFQDQPPEEIAREELAEETGGYEPETVIPLMKRDCLIEPVFTYQIYPFLFLDCRKTNHQARQDKNEYIELATFPIQEWMVMCDSGQIRDIISIAVTALAKGYLNSLGWKL